MTAKQKKVLIWKNKCWEARGSNLGDLAIISAMVSSIKEKSKDIEIVMLSDDPQYTEELYGIESCKINICNIFRIIKDIDLFLIGGGTVFTDKSSIYIILINTGLAYLANLFGKPIACYAIGTGKMTWFGRMLVKGLLGKFKFICVRDEESKEELLNLGGKLGGPVIVTEDAAFSLVDYINGENIVGSDVIIAPRRIFHYKHSILPFYLRKKFGLLPKEYYIKMEEFKNMLADISNYMISKYDCTISFLPMYSALGKKKGISGYLKNKFSSRDDLICEDIKNRINQDGKVRVIYNDKPIEILKAISQSRMLIGVPLHSLILSHVANTPFIGFSYQEKVSRFMNHVNMREYMIHAENSECELDYSEIVKMVDKVMTDREILKNAISKKNAEIKLVVKKPAELVISLLEGN